MLRPERMSKVSVAGSKRVLESTIEAVYEMRLLDLSEYDESWESFDLGRSLEGADRVNEKLVTVRSLESILDVTDEDADETIVIDDDQLDADLATLQETVNDLDDRRSELRTRIRELDEEIEDIEPFADLGLELSLLSGYDSLVVSVGEGNREAIESTLAADDSIETFEIMSGSRTHAIFAKPTAEVGDEVLADALVGVDFATVPVPDAEGSPEEYVEELEAQQADLRADLEEIETELEEIKAEQASFLLSAEEYLSIEAQKKEAPLSFATTDNAFVAEGWIPSERYEEFESSLTAAVDGPLDIDEIKRAQFKSNGDHHVEETASEPSTVEDQTATEEPAADDGSGETEKARADGGVVTTSDDPPVVQDNPRGAKAFEVLVGAVAKPKYNEFDPTILVFLTFPLMFGFMIGDVGYGVIYTAIGYFLYTKYESSGLKSMGGVAMWAGAFTILFGIMYDEVFGLHPFAEPMSTFIGLPVLHKGLKPQYADWALAWFTVSVLVGLIHVNMAYILSFIEDNELHGFKEALYESGSWLFMLNGLWMFVFSKMNSSPEFIFNVFADGGVIPLGFEGLPVVFGQLGLAAFVIGLILLGLGSLPELAEALSVLVNVLSYTRLGAVLLAKAGMAYAVNLIVFGSYTADGKVHYIFTPEHLADIPAEQVGFAGLMTGGDAIGYVAGAVVLLVGHAAVLTLGITSAGLQAVRLEYVEFFSKFYDGGGRSYNPFGYVRQYTTTDN